MGMGHPCKFLFFMAFVSVVDFVFQLRNLERALLTTEKMLAPFPMEGKIVSLQIYFATPWN